MNAEIIAECEHMYVQAMGQVAVARSNRIDDGDTERAEVRIARVAALRLQAEHTKHAAHALDQLAQCLVVLTDTGRAQTSLELIDALTALGDELDIGAVREAVRQMAVRVGLNVSGHGYGRSSRNV